MLQFGLNPDYVLDQMQIYEINSLMKYSYYKNKEDWEMTRLLAYIQAQTNSTKKLKLEDIIKFNWEKENEEEQKKTDNSVTKEELEEMMREADEMKKIMFGE